MEMKKIFTLAYFLAFLAIASSSCREDHDKLSSRVSVASAPSPDASLVDVCSNVIFEMMDCVSYLSAGSTSSKPGSSCCKGAKSVVNFNGKCICVAIETSSQLGIQLNMTRVQSLPSICGIDYSLKNCGRLSGSSPTPSSSPVESPHLSPAPVEAPALTPAPVEAPAMTPDPVEAPAMTPYPVEAPAMTPGPVNGPAMTPDQVDAPAVAPYPIEAPAVTRDPVEAPVMSLDPSQTPAMTPDPVPTPVSPETCYDIMYNMMECIPFLVKGSTWRQPGHPCCEGYKFTLDFDGQCICTTLKSSGELGIQLNMTRVEGLPSLCGVEHGYPLKKCGIDVASSSSPPASRTAPPKDSESPSLMSSSVTATVVSSIVISFVFLLSYY